MLENPEILQQMVKETGAKSTDLQSPESAEHLCGKCQVYAEEWTPEAEELWNDHHFVKTGYVNYEKKKDQ